MHVLINEAGVFTCTRERFHKQPAVDKAHNATDIQRHAELVDELIGAARRNAHTKFSATRRQKIQRIS